MAILLVAGFKHYVRLQYLMFAATGILVVILIVQFLRTSPEEFAAAMNHFSNVVDGRDGLLQVDPEGRRRRRRQPPAQVRPRRHAARRADRLDEPAVGHLQRGAGRRDQGRPRLQEPDVHHRRLDDRHGRQLSPSSPGRGAGRRHRLLQRRVPLLLLRVQRLRRRDRQRPALPGHVRHRDLPQPDHHDPRGGQLHARVAADHLQLLHRHDAHHGRHVARPHAAGLAVQGQPALSLADERPPHLLSSWGASRSTATTTMSSGTA